MLKSNSTPIVGLHFTPFVLTNEKYPYPYIHKLYPYTTETYAVVFVYGKDVPQPRPPGILAILSVGNYWFILIWFTLATIILFVIRWQVGFHPNIWLSTLDMITVFCGGGRIRFRHKFEKLYLVIMLIGAFFLLSFCTSTFTSRITSPNNLNNINTYEKLSELRTPIYASSLSGNDSENVYARLRFVTIQ